MYGNVCLKSRSCQIFKIGAYAFLYFVWWKGTLTPNQMIKTISMVHWFPIFGDDDVLTVPPPLTCAILNWYPLLPNRYGEETRGSKETFSQVKNDEAGTFPERWLTEQRLFLRINWWGRDFSIRKIDREKEWGSEDFFPHWKRENGA